MKIKMIIVSLLVMVVSGNALAQNEAAKLLMDNTPYQKVVLADIEAQVLTPGSDYFYPELYKRYEKGDTTLTLADYRHLYYGYMYQSDYRPHTEPPYVDSLSNLLNRDGAVFTDKSSATSLRYLKEILEDRPFSLKFLNMMAYLCDAKIGDREMAMKYSYKFKMVLSAIFSSGNGREKTSPWMVLYRSDAAGMLQFIGADVAKRIFITTNVEYYSMKTRHGNVRGYYFDFDPIYTRPNEPKGKRKMEFNPLSNPKSDKYINQKQIL